MSQHKAITVPLPEGVEVREHIMGVAYYEKGKDEYFLIHPLDNDSIRKLVWQIWLAKHPHKTHRCNCALVEKP